MDLEFLTEKSTTDDFSPGVETRILKFAVCGRGGGGSQVKNYTNLLKYSLKNVKLNK